MEWGDFLTSTSQDMIGRAAMPTTVSAAPVAQSPAGLQYTVGQPLRSMVSADGKIFGLPKMAVLGGGAAILLLVGYFVMKK